MKSVKIISTVFASRSYREKTIQEGVPLIYSVGSQNFQTNDDIKKLIELNISEEIKTDPGTDLDLAIVNNNVDNEEGNLFLNKYNGVKLKRGKVKVIHRPNNLGWSFGAYSYGFKILKNNYDYFIFSEDDTIINRNFYAIDAIEKFNEIKNCGFVAFIGINYKKYFNLSKNDCVHAHGGVGLSSKNVLIKIEEKNKELPYYKGLDTNNYLEIIKSGEIKFTNIIHKNKFQLININNNIKYFDFAYDLMRGLKIPLRDVS